MIKSKFLGPIIAIFMLISIIFTIVLTYFSSSLSIETAAKVVNLDYESKVFNKEEIMTVDIIINEDTWSNLLDNATSETYVLCDLVINGEKINNVGIRAKGNTTLTQIAQDDTTDRYSFKIKFDQYVDQTLHGLNKLVLNNIMSDATYMKEYMAYDMLEYMGVANPLFSFASITVNGEPWGLYFALEAMEESYALRNFGSSYGQLYKPESVSMNGVNDNREAGNMEFDFSNNVNGKQSENIDNTLEEKGQNSNISFEKNNKGIEMTNKGIEMNNKSFGGTASTDLKYIDDNIESYSDIFESAVFDSDEDDYKRVIEALKNINEGKDLENYIDIEQTLKYFAVNSVLVNFDSYTGSLKHNYYLYENDGILTMLPWDFNLAFAGFQSNDSSSAINSPIDTPVSGTSLSERPMIGQLLAEDDYKELYHSYLAQLMNEYFDSGRYIETIEKVDDLIKNYVKEDKTAFYTFDEYQLGVDTLKNFGLLRAESIKGQLNGTIPSTEEAQKLDSSNLIDASSINVTSMGSQGGTGNFHGGNMPNRNTQGEFDFEDEGVPAMGMPPNGNEVPNRNGMTNRNGMSPDINEIPNISQTNRTGYSSIKNLDKSTYVNITIMLISIFLLILSLVLLKNYKRRKYRV